MAVDAHPRCRSPCAACGWCRCCMGALAGAAGRSMAVRCRRLRPIDLSRALESPANDCASFSEATLIRVVRRDPFVCWSAPASATVITTSPIGFAGAAEDDRRRWLNGFRRLLDGLDAPLQVVIEVEPGSGEEERFSSPTPSRYAGMRGADMCFVDEIRRSDSSHRVTTSMVTVAGHSQRLQAALSEMGIQFDASEPASETVFGRE